MIISITEISGLIQSIEDNSFSYHDVHTTWPSDIWPDIEFSYEGSLDAAENLHVALIPDWLWQKVGGKFTVYRPYPSIKQVDVHIGAKTDSCAWLIAILKAYMEQIDA